MSTIAADGSINVTVTDGSSLTGLYAANGSWNVVLDETANAPTGLYHASGGLNVIVTTSSDNGRYAPTGAYYVTESPYVENGALKVTAVSGDLTPA